MWIELETALTPDDYGDYTKFNYTFVGKKDWRFPYDHAKATYNEGFKSNRLDDVGNYSYGSRDEWYVHSIETKTHIAEFIYKDRNDAIPSDGQHGGLGSGPKSKQLHQIKLYTRKGKEFGHGPIKTVHFVYDYSLCLGVPDNDINDNSLDVNEDADQGGKLTLKEVYFTNYDSPQGELNRYEFIYNGGGSYDLGNVDRWGYYQDDGQSINFDVTANRNNAEYPYTRQDKTTADIHAKVWRLATIKLPTGGRVMVDYESHDYEYIQDEEATIMYDIIGFYSTSDDQYNPVFADFNSNLFDPDDKEENSFYMLVDLDAIIDGTQSDAEDIFRDHFKPANTSPGIINQIYFNTLINLAPHNDGILDNDLFEYIQGYAEFKDNDWYLLETSPGSQEWDKVVFKLKSEPIGFGVVGSNAKCNPVSRKAWQVIKEALPLALYPEDDLTAIYAKDASINCDNNNATEDGGTKPKLGDKNSKNHKKNMKSLKSVYHMMRNTGFASRAKLDKNKGWVRMRPGLKPKFGGGSRVKTVKVI